MSVANPISLFATLGRDRNGLEKPGAVMWSADMEVKPGLSLTASGSTPADALKRLHLRIAKEA